MKREIPMEFSLALSKSRFLVCKEYEKENAPNEESTEEFPEG